MFSPGASVAFGPAVDGPNPRPASRTDRCQMYSPRWARMMRNTSRRMVYPQTAKTGRERAARSGRGEKSGGGKTARTREPAEETEGGAGGGLVANGPCGCGKPGAALDPAVGSVGCCGPARGEEEDTKEAWKDGVGK